MSWLTSKYRFLNSVERIDFTVNGSTCSTLTKFYGGFLFFSFQAKLWVECALGFSILIFGSDVGSKVGSTVGWKSSEIEAGSDVGWKVGSTRELTSQ